MSIYNVDFLGFNFDLDPVAFTLPIGDGWSVYWYGIAIALGFLLAFLYGLNRAPKLGINNDRLLDAVLITTPIAIIGARAYYLLFYSPGSFFSDFFKIHDGGLAIYGGIIGAVIGIIISCKTRKINFLDCLDLVAPCFFIGQAIGRWGNFFNQEAFGVNTNLPWGMYSNGTEASIIADTLNKGNPLNLDPTKPVHPCFLYESILCIIGFIILHFVMKKRKFRGQIVLIYGMWYGFGRFFIEGIRTDSLMAGSLRVSQVLSSVIVIACIIVYILLHRRYKEKCALEGGYKPMFNENEQENLSLSLKDVMEEGTEITEEEGWES